MSVKLSPPLFDCKSKRYDRYMQEVDAWCLVSKVDKKEQAVVLALSLPDSDESGVKDKLFNDISLADLNIDGGVNTFKTFMDGLFKKDDLTETYERYVEFDRFVRVSTQSIDEFIMEFDKLYNRAAKRDIKLPEVVKAFKLLEAAKLSHQDKLFVLTAVDYEHKDKLYDQAKSALRKFKGGQATPGGASSGATAGNYGIKLEPAFLAQNEEALLAAGYVKKRNNGNWRGIQKGGGGAWRGRYSNGRGNRAANDAHIDSWRGNYNGGRGYSGNHRNSVPSGPAKKLNPIAPDGERRICVSCGSFRHLLSDCPDSWENMASANLAEDMQNFKAEDANVCDVILFTGDNKTEIAKLGREASNSGVLDSACSSTVAGTVWMETCLDSMTLETRAQVKIEPGRKKYRFGGGVILPSLAEVTFPSVLAGQSVLIETSVVQSDIPLLLSLTFMKQAGVQMDYVNDRAKIFGTWINLDFTSSVPLLCDTFIAGGHSSLNSCLLASDQLSIPLVCDTVFADSHNSVNSCLLTLEEVDDDDDGKRRILLKLHRQFGHKNAKVIEQLLKDSNGWKEEYKDILRKIGDGCKVCKQFQKTPSRPVVCLRPASYFREVLTVDLKQWGKRYIMYMIDAFTRFTQSCILDRKLPHLIVHNLLIHWFGIFGAPGVIWSDVGGEFSNEEILDMSENLGGVEIKTTAGYSPWMNGINERNHYVTDRILEKILIDHPDMPLDIASCWADMAKNSLQMHNGFSSYQLVFGDNPKLPCVTADKLPGLEGVTTSETVYKHIQALHAARLAYIETESCERIRRALRNKVRASEKVFVRGDKCYYKREEDRWRGPATVIGNDGKIYFLRHGGYLVRVSINRLVGVEDAEQYAIDNPEENLAEQNIPQEATARESFPIDDKQKKSNIEVVIGDDTAENNELILNREPPVNTQTVPKANDVIDYKQDGIWKRANVLSRAGKQSKYSRNKAWVNVKPHDSSVEPLSINLDQCDWRYVSTEKNGINDLMEESVNITRIPKERHGDEACVEAKLKELKNFEDLKVYDEIEDVGQDRISCCWILTE